MNQEGVHHVQLNMAGVANPPPAIANGHAIFIADHPPPQMANGHAIILQDGPEDEEDNNNEFQQMHVEDIEEPGRLISDEAIIGYIAAITTVFIIGGAYLLYRRFYSVSNS